MPVRSNVCSAASTASSTVRRTMRGAMKLLDLIHFLRSMAMLPMTCYSFIFAKWLFLPKTVGSAFLLRDREIIAM
ncbi:hypothetical protein GYMLUDRAFT_38077 [Collybiopsis luxurians FD-317 M1]|nr:hypothetical protein GYMLUDRAFT_38077 [Collybiopsis luxurians FD-317 M1]